jgi:hypothetical protein
MYLMKRMHNNQSKNQKMKQSVVLNLKLFAVFVFMAGNIFAQQKLAKVTQKIKVDKDVTIDLNTSNCNIVFDTWNKNEVSIEAYMESDELSKEELQAALKNWKVEVIGSSKLVSISSKGSSGNTWNIVHSDGDDHIVELVLGELKYELADMPEMDFNFVMPEMPEMPVMPKIPELPELPELPKDAKNIHFDYEAYKKDGEKYLKEYSEKFESTFGKDYANKMEAWGEKFGKEWEEKFGEEYAKKMEAWGEKFGKEWEAKYGEEYAKKMEAWGERFAEKMDERASRIEERVVERDKMLAEREKLAAERAKLADERRVKIGKLIHSKNESKAKKTIIIKMPKDSKLKLNVKHGELKLASVIENVHANLYYAHLIANSINGSRTSINASYSTLNVTNWNVGTLDLKYVKKATIDNVTRIMLTSKSSDISVDNLINSAIINGSIGSLTISKIDDAFNNLNITIENSDALITLPNVKHNLQYNGNRSKFSHPKKLNEENISNFTVGDLSSPKAIVINAKYSNVAMQ